MRTPSKATALKNSTAISDSRGTISIQEIRDNVAAQEAADHLADEIVDLATARGQVWLSRHAVFQVRAQIMLRPGVWITARLGHKLIMCELQLVEAGVNLSCRKIFERHHDINCRSLTIIPTMAQEEAHIIARHLFKRAYGDVVITVLAVE